MRARNLGSLIISLLFILPALNVSGEEVLNLGPLLYIDKDEETGAQKIDAFGPFVTYEKSPEGEGYGLRPLFYNFSNYKKDRAGFDFLYPLLTHRTFDGDTKLQLLVYLFYYKSDLRQSGFREREYTLFPFVYGRHAEDSERSFFAVFPLAGKMNHKYGKDEISFFLFPLYLRTKNYGMTNNNVLWPFFGSYSGEGVSGGRFWPLYGHREKEDEFKDTFALWPVYMNREKNFYGSTVSSTALLPFYYGVDMPGRKQRTYVWPFFTTVNDTNEGFRRWDMPWPFITYASGSINTKRIWPLYSLRKEKDYETGFIMWPLLGYERYQFLEHVRVKRTFGLFIFKEIIETPSKEGGKSGKSVHLWPLFSSRTMPDGESYFRFLSILETFLGENPPRERNWSPFWRLFEWRMDAEGNQKSSLLWNTIRTERTSDGAKKFELRPIVPVISFEDSKDRSKLYILGGLFGYKSTPEKKTVRILFIPVNISSGKSDESTNDESGGS